MADGGEKTRDFIRGPSLTSASPPQAPPAIYVTPHSTPLAGAGGSVVGVPDLTGTGRLLPLLSSRLPSITPQHTRGPLDCLILTIE